MRAPAADLILHNGRIYTVDAKRSWASAVAISKGRFIAIGDDATVEAVRAASTEIVDLAGRMAMPGIVDIHTHMLMGGQAELFELNFSSACHVDEICAAVRAWADKTPPGGWIVGAQWGSDKLPALNLAASLAKLDEAAQGRPVMLRDESAHNRWCSSEDWSSAHWRIPDITRRRWIRRRSPIRSKRSTRSASPPFSKRPR
jgi:predicted amidohydrolase YtcJ